ncbi:MAG: FtsX-like permease family protein [Nitrospirota bacterium]
MGVLLSRLEALLMLGRGHFFERPVRTLLTVAGVALGVSASVAVRTANVDVLKSFQDAVMTVAGSATLQVSGGELGLDETVITIVREHPDVTSASPVIEQGVRVAAGPHRGQSFVVLGLDLLEAAELKSFRVRSEGTGERALHSLLSATALFVGRRLAAELGLTQGSTLDILVGNRLRQITVKGVIEPPSGPPSVWEDLAVMDIAAAQMLFGMVGRLDRIDVVTAPTRPVDDVQAALQAIVPPSVVVQRPAQRSRQVEEMVRAFQLNLGVLSGVGLLVGMFLIYNTVSFAVAQRRREIGIFRALGMSERAVAGLFLAEAAAIGIVGGLLGGALGLALAKGLVSLLSRTVSDLYVSVVGTGDRTGIGMEAILGVLAEGALIGGLVSMVGALGPSLDAGRTVPVLALAPGGYEASRQLRRRTLAGVGCAFLIASGLLAMPGPISGLPVFGYLSTLCLLVGLSCLAPLLIQGVWAVTHRRRRDDLSASGALRAIAADQTARSPGRNGVTVSALMIGLAIMVGVGIMVRSFRHTVEIWINETVIADLVLAPSLWLRGTQHGTLDKRLPREWGALVASVPGVAAVDAYRDLRIDIQGRSTALVSRDLRLHAERSRYLFVSGDSAAILRRAAAKDGVILSEVLAGYLGVKQGDTLSLMTPSGEQRFPIMGVFYDYATDGGKVVMDQSLYRRLWRDDSVTVFPVYLEPGADLNTVRKAIAQKLAGESAAYAPPALISNAELKREILDIFDRTFFLTYALEAIAVIIAVLGIVNTLLTSVLERQRELATLRAIGASEQQIHRLVLWEAGYLGVLGAALGLAGGILLSLLLIKVINKQSFGWTIQPILPMGVLVQAVVLAVAAALLAGYVPARWAGKQPIVEGLRYE